VWLDPVLDILNELLSKQYLTEPIGYKRYLDSILFETDRPIIDVYHGLLFAHRLFLPEG
jgi:hypothetical protein